MFRDAEAIERLRSVDTLVVDKTGTLTEGVPKLFAIRAREGFSDTELLRLAASLERASEHPLASALLRAAGEREPWGCAARERISPVEAGARSGCHRRRALIIANKRTSATLPIT